MFAVQTLNKISPLGLAVFPPERYSVADEAKSPDAILVRSAALHDLEFAPSLKAIARAGAGVNNIPIERCSEAGIVVFNTPGANANSVKELVVAALLLAARDVQQGMQWVREQATTPDLAKLVEKEKGRFAGTEIMGKTLGVVGLGAIGVLVCNAAASLGMRVIGFDPFISVESAWDLSRAIERAQSVDHLLAQSDYVTLHVPLNDQTKNMIDAERLAKMKAGSTLLNFARGGLVDETALVVSLTSGHTARYVTDFPNEEISSHPRVLGVPHLGASTEEAEENCAVMASRQLRDYLEQGVITNSVNFPDCVLSGSGHPRVVVANRNIPNMMGQITTVLAGRKINILDLLNRHRGDLAYNIIDTASDVPAEVVDRLRAIDGVIFVRTIPSA